MPRSHSSPQHPLIGLEPGARFGSYDIVRCIGVGGMGSVFEATHRLMHRRVALKVLHAYGNADPRARERFMREGATLVRVEHPHIVAVYDAGEVDGLPFIAMELLVGSTLDRVLDREGILAPARAIALIGPVARGLSEAHRAGIVHRDVKPENLFVTTTAGGGELLKLVDFGIAKDVSARGGSKNTMIGTPDYMAPEQLLDSRPVDARADQYALAVVIYQALTGTRPFVAESVLGLAMLLERGEPPLPPSKRGVLVNPALDRAILRALSIAPNERFESIGDFADALRESLLERPEVTPTRLEAVETDPSRMALGPSETNAASSSVAGVRSARERRLLAGLAGLAGLVALATLALLATLVATRIARPAPSAMRVESGGESGSPGPSEQEHAANASPGVRPAAARETASDQRTDAGGIPRGPLPRSHRATTPRAESDPDAHAHTDPPVLRLER